MTDGVGRNGEGKGGRRVEKRVEEGKDVGEKGWKREKVGRKRGRKDGERSWGGIGDCAVLKISLKSRGPGPTLTLKQSVDPVQDWALSMSTFRAFA